MPKSGPWRKRSRSCSARSRRSATIVRANLLFSIRVVDFLAMGDNHARMSKFLSLDDLRSTLTALGEVLAQRGLSYEVVLVGGANLLLRGIISRPTKDGDLLAQRLADGHVVEMRELPGPLLLAVRDVARAYGLADDWLNVGPASVLDLGLPLGFAGRLTREDFGALTVWLAGRHDLICFKLYAAADHWPTKDRHLADLRAIGPNRAELLAAGRWALTHDSSPGFRSLLCAVLAESGIEDADAVLR
jgi:hypothetical protein